MKNLYFTIVIPLYNKSYSIRRCLDSVLSQSYLNYYIILVDDGSTDESLSIVEDVYRKEISTNILKVIRQPNKGVSAARNAGVEASSTDLICFLDADDEWLPDFLIKMKQLVNDFPNAVLYSFAHFVDKGKGIRKVSQSFPENFKGYVNDFFGTSSRGSVVNSSKVCVRKDALLNVGGFPCGVVAGEDLHVWIMLALKGRVVFSMDYLAIIHQEADGSRFARKLSVPYPFIFFSSNKKMKKGKGLNKYLFSIFIKHFVSSVISFKFKEASYRLYYFVRMFI